MLKHCTTYVLCRLRSRIPYSVFCLLSPLSRLPSSVFCLLAVSNFNRLDVVRRRESEDLAVEVELGLEAADDRLGATEAVLLAFEQEQRHRESFRAYGGGHHLRLVRRHDLVLESLEQDQRARQAIDEVNRG